MQTDLWLQRWLSLMTEALVARIHQTLRPGAMLRLFGRGWRVLGLEEVVTHKYTQPKSVWEAVLEAA